MRKTGSIIALSAALMALLGALYSLFLASVLSHAVPGLGHEAQVSGGIGAVIALISVIISALALNGEGRISGVFLILNGIVGVLTSTFVVAAPLCIVMVGALLILIGEGKQKQVASGVG
jgi:hypothetical protein